MVLNNFIVDTTITWDRVGRSIFENPQAKPGRKLRVQVTNAGVIEDLTGSTLNLGWKNPSNGIEGLDIFTAVDITKGIFEIEYTEGMLSNLGNLKASLQLVNTTVDLLAESNDFVIRVSPSTVNPDASQSIGSWTAFAEILLNEDAREEAAAEHAAAFATYDARINQVEVGVVHPVTNIIASNSDFATTDGLVLNSATVAAANNILTITGTGGASNPNAGFNLLNIPTGKKVYMRVWARVLNDVCQKMTIRSEATETSAIVANPVNGQWYELTTVRTKTGTLESPLNMSMTHTYASSATASGKTMEVKWAVAINLTDDFESGAEPTADYVNLMMKIFQEKYFTGTQAVYPLQVLANDMNDAYQVIDDKFDAFVQTNIVQEEVAEVFNNLEETYAQDIVSVKQQLEQKADLADLPSSAYTFKGSTTFAALPTTGNTLGDVRYVTDGTPQNYAWTGTAWTPIGNGAFANGSVTTAKLANVAATRVKVANKAVGYYNSDFIVVGKNLFNKDTCIANTWCNYTNGVVETVAGYYLGDFIPVLPEMTYRRKINQSINFYDANYNWISGLLNSGTFTTPANCAYIRINVTGNGTGNRDMEQVEVGADSTDFEPFGYKLLTPLNNFKLKLPPVIYGVVGKEINVYFDNILLCDNINDYTIDAICTKGTQQNERWTWVVDAAGTYPLTIDIYQHGVKILTQATNVVTKAATVGNGVTKKALFIGDSTTDAGVYTGELVTMFGADVMDLELLGTRGTAPNRHEGRGGWTALNYVTNASLYEVVNPFYNNGFDFSNYMLTQGYTSVDNVGIHLGINDVFAFYQDADLNTEITNVLARFDTMVNSIKAYDTNIKVGIMITIPPSYNQDAFGKNYTSGQNRWRYRRNNFMFVDKLIDKYKNREAEGIYLVPINVNLDTKNNMSTETVAVNARNTATVTRQSNGVHPATSGYGQIADVNYYWLKSFEV